MQMSCEARLHSFYYLSFLQFRVLYCHFKQENLEE